MTYGYDTNLKKGDWKKTLESLAKTLLENLSSIRDVSPNCISSLDSSALTPA
jgi:hypothetical protein